MQRVVEGRGVKIQTQTDQEFALLNSLEQSSSFCMKYASAEVVEVIAVMRKICAGDPEFVAAIT